MSLDQTLEEVCKKLGLKVPPPPKPAGTYRPLVVSNGFAFVSGQLSRDAEGRLVTGKVGKEVPLEEGKRAAHLATLQALSLVKAEIGLDRVEQVARLAGFVQAANDFYAQSDVMNAASELLVEVFGEKGRHARTSIGVASLPLNAAVEIELTLKVK
jgi:enamine deaminase RidA (YjgF/YER057c/UK114 family)